MCNSNIEEVESKSDSIGVTIKNKLFSIVKKHPWYTAVAVVFACIRFFGPASSESSPYPLGEDDFKTVTGDDRKFYDDPSAPKERVLANKKMLPDWFDETPFSYLLPAMSKVEEFGQGKVFLVAPEDPKGWVKVAHVGDGFVIAEHLDLWAYIKTSDDYVDGQHVRKGLYRYIGNHSVPLTDGSSKRIRAFEHVDQTLGERVIEALAWNEECEKEANRENSKREKRRKYWVQVHEVLGKIARTPYCKVHIPAKFNLPANTIEIEVPPFKIGLNHKTVNLMELVKRAKNREYDYFCELCLEADERPESLVRDLEDAMVKYVIHGIDAESYKIKGRYSIQAIKTDRQHGFRMRESSETYLRSGYEFYVYEEDPLFKEVAGDPWRLADFLAHWDELYKE